MREGALIPRFGRARRDRELAVLEGLHPLKHALRFEAELLEVVTSDRPRLEALVAELAPDVAPQVRELAQEVSPEVFAQLAPMTPSTGVMSLARRPAADISELLGARGGPLVLLEDPRDLGNLGACVRVAAAAAAGGLVAIGGHDPWHPDALRGAAGLHFALPVARVEELSAVARSGRPLLGLDPEGEPLRPDELPADAILAFGSERRGLSPDLRAHADGLLSIPMRPGVSSLNLATSVSAVLYAWRLSAAGIGLGRVEI